MNGFDNSLMTDSMRSDFDFKIRLHVFGQYKQRASNIIGYSQSEIRHYPKRVLAYLTLA